MLIPISGLHPKRGKVRSKRQILNARNVEKFRQRQVAKGLCLSCAEKAEPGKLRCLKHLEQTRAISRKHSPRIRQLRKERNLCMRCGAPKEPGVSFLNCVNCRSHIEGTKRRRKLVEHNPYLSTKKPQDT